MMQTMGTDSNFAYLSSAINKRISLARWNSSKGFQYSVWKHRSIRKEKLYVYVPLEKHEIVK